MGIDSLKSFAKGWNSPFQEEGSAGGGFGGTARIWDIPGSSLKEESGSTGVGSPMECGLICKTVTPGPFPFFPPSKRGF